MALDEALTGHADALLPGLTYAALWASAAAAVGEERIVF